MPLTYEPLATTTLGSDQATVSFTSISGSYTDLILVIFVRNTNASTDRQILVQFNSDTGSNYSYTDIRGLGSSAASGGGTSTSSILCGLVEDADDNYSISRINVMNYSNTTTNKTLVSRGDSSGNRTDATVGLWRSTAAITSIQLSTNEDSYKSGSTFTLYGIKAA